MRQKKKKCFAIDIGIGKRNKTIERWLMGKTKIDWCDKVWNSVTGCTKISGGCQNCYAEKMTRRLKAMGQYKYRNGFEEVTTHEDELGRPINWKKPSLIFVNSMSDTFHEKVPKRFIHSIFNVMKFCDRHVFQVLTKRPGNIPPNLEWPNNVWCGVTVCNQAEANRKIPLLLHVPSKVRFVSIEPMLGPINLLGIKDPKIEGSFDSLTKKSGLSYNGGIDWVIAGSESGPARRHVPIEYFGELKNQCAKANTPFFFKQFSTGNIVQKMPTLNGESYREMPRAFYEHWINMQQNK